MRDMRDRTCCFTGHRKLPASTADLRAVLDRTEAHVRSLLQQGVTFFGVGGAVGYDTEAAKLLFRLRDREFPCIRVILVYPFDGYKDRWTDEQRREADELETNYDKIVRISDVASKSAYLRRDRHLVDASAFCICFCCRTRGGTAYTVRYAHEKQLKIFNTADFRLEHLFRGVN